jgi:hypothetical protein
LRVIEDRLRIPPVRARRLSLGGRMPQVRKFDAQIRFILSAKLKHRLEREAARRRMSAAELLRLYIEEGLGRAAPIKKGRQAMVAWA